MPRLLAPLALLLAGVLAVTWFAWEWVEEQTAEFSSLTPEQLEPRPEASVANQGSGSLAGLEAGAPEVEQPVPERERVSAADTDDADSVRMRLAGRVVGPHGLKPLGARVEFRFGGTAGDTVRPVEHSTDSEGHFETTVGADRAVSLRATHPDYAPSEWLRLKAASDATLLETIELRLQMGGSLRVELDVPHDPETVLAGSATCTTLQGELISTVSLANGSGLIGPLPPGAYRVEIAIKPQAATQASQSTRDTMPTGWVRAREDVHVHAGRETVVRLGEGRLHLLRGRTLLRGEPTGGASVQLRKEGGGPQLHDTTSMADGEFRLLSLSPPPYELIATLDQRTILLHLEPVEAERFQEIELSGALLSGVLLDQHGTPRHGITVTGEDCQEQRDMHAVANPRFSTQTDEFGQFSVEYMHEGCAALTWRDANGATQRQRVEDIQHGEQRDRLVLREPKTHAVMVELRLPPGTTLSGEGSVSPSSDRPDFDGYFLESSRLPQPQLRVAVFDGEGRHHETFSLPWTPGGDKARILLQLPFERARFQGQNAGQTPGLLASRMSAWVDLKGAEQALVELDLKPAGNLNVITLAENGRNVGAQLRVIDGGGIDLQPSLNSYGGGHNSTSLHPLLPGSYRVEARNHSGTVVSQDVLVQPGPTALVTLQF